MDSNFTDLKDLAMDVVDYNNDTLPSQFGQYENLAHNTRLQKYRTVIPMPQWAELYSPFLFKRNLYLSMVYCAHHSKQTTASK